MSTSQTTQQSGINWKIMAPMFAVTTMGGIAMGVVLPLLPFYSTQFGASPFMVGLIVAVFALCQFFSGPILGRYSDKYGRKTVLLISQLGMLTGLVMLAGAQSLWMIFAARILEGLTAGNMSVAAAAAADSSTPATRKQAMGLISAAMGLGFIIGPALPALLPFETLSAPIWVAVGLQVVTLLATLFFFPNMKSKSASATQKVPPKMSIKELLSHQSVLLIFVSLGIFYFVFSGLMAQFALFSEAKFTFNGAPVTEKHIAWLFSGFGAINVIVQLGLMGMITRYFSDKSIAIMAGLLIISGFVGFAVASSFTGLCIATALIAIGNTLTRPTLMSALSIASPNDKQGAVMGLNQSLMAVMGVIAPPLSGLLITHHFYNAWALAGATITALSMLVTLALFMRNLWPSTQANPA